MPPRVVLVEDDASLRRFVALALEDLGVDLVECETVAGAVAALQAAPACLVLTDLMLPGESGLSLIERLHAEPGLRGPARVAVFSAGLDAAMSAQLGARGVWRLLRKPVPLAALEACVREAMQQAAGERPPAPDASTNSGSVHQFPQEHEAIAHHFGGDAALFHAFKAGCLQQFGADLSAGDAACTATDLASLRRTAHSLKTVLQLLGDPAGSALAHGAEEAAARLQTQEAISAWVALSGKLRDLLAV